MRIYCSQNVKKTIAELIINIKCKIGILEDINFN